MLSLDGTEIPDERRAEFALSVRDRGVHPPRRCLRTVSIRFTTASGLFYGQSGLALAHAEAAAALPEHDTVRYDAARLTALFKHAVPHHSGVRWPGSHGSRLSADLWTDSAGVLVALEHALTGTP